MYIRIYCFQDLASLFVNDIKCPGRITGKAGPKRSPQVSAKSALRNPRFRPKHFSGKYYFRAATGSFFCCFSEVIRPDG